jgi:hypothetical protein
MSTNDPRRQLGTGRDRGRMDRPPGWADSLFAGRSRADKEADQDAMLKVMIVFGGALVLLLVGLHALFRMVGLQLGWWSAPVFVPLFVWLFASAGLRRSLRPVELDELRWRERLAGAGALLVLLWVCWPLWAGPVAKAWKAGHGGLGSIAGDGPRYPIHAVLAASPVAMGVVAFLLLALGMVLAPRIRPREPEHTPPPGGPEPLRPALLAERPADRPRWPDHPRWP